LSYRGAAPMLAARLRQPLCACVGCWTVSWLFCRSISDLSCLRSFAGAFQAFDLFQTSTNCPGVSSLWTWMPVASFDNSAYCLREGRIT